MKKSLTLVFSTMAAIMSGCGNSSDNQIMEEVLRDIPTVTETTERVDIYEADVETFTTTAATTSERAATVSETEVTFDYDDSMFPVGRWVDITDIDETFYSFDENEQLEIGLQTHSVFGKYKFEDETLTLILDMGVDDDSSYHAEFAFDIQQEENGYRLYYNSEKSTGEIELPDMDSVSHTSDQELIVGLTNLFSGYESRESIFLEFYEIWYADRY